MRHLLALALPMIAGGLTPAAAQAPRYGIAPPRFSSSTTPLPVLLGDPAAHAVIQRRAPALLANPNLPRSRSLTLADVQPFAGGILSAPVIAAIDADLAALPPSPAAEAQAREAIAAIDAARLDPAAPWITHPAAFAADFARLPVALQFRRTIALPARPSAFRVRISADNRFVLFVNGRRMAAGPARGDLGHYRVEEIDLASFLKAGANTVAAEVWSDGKFAPVADISAGHSGLMVKGVDPAAAVLDAGPGWAVRVDRSRTSSSGRAQISAAVGPAYYAAGAPEQHRAADQLDDWTGPAAGSDWQAAVPAVTGGGTARTLVPDALPPMRYDPLPPARVVRATGVAAASFPARPLVVPARTEAAVLVDMGRVLAAYPVLRVSGGRGATVALTYTEALYEPQATGSRGGAVRFADRARIADGRALGLTDTLVADGRPGRRLAPFWWRAWRFAEIRVKTGDQPLTLDGFDAFATGYPFTRAASFASSDPELDRIWQVGWDTARFNAHETYMDTAYWEQIQYIGDTRIQALISYDVAGDPRLAVQALDAFNDSRVVDGLPQSSWPISTANPIPPYALLWIGMLHDYWMRVPDPAPLRRNLAGMRAVLDWYRPYVRPDGTVRATPGWLFVDWRDGLDGGRDRDGKAPDSCVIALQRLGALREAADIERAVGDPARATADLADAAQATRGIQDRCWDAGRGLYADTPEKQGFSQHANVLAVLFDVAPPAARRAILERVTVPGHGIDAPAGITPSTFYFSFYLARALDHAGMADRYLDLLVSWRALLAQHFTTWPENPDPTRSDSHAWSAHPTSGLLGYVAGIASDAPGFARVRIAPHLGPLTRLEASMPHPAGTIRVRYRVAGGRLDAELTLPPALAGTFVLGGRDYPLHGGVNHIVAPVTR